MLALLSLQLQRMGRAAVRAAAGLCVGAVGFLWAYVTLHLAHVAGFHVGVASGSIPLFSIFAASAAAGAASSVLATVGVRRADRLLATLPRLLAISITCFGAAVILFP